MVRKFLSKSVVVSCLCVLCAGPSVFAGPTPLNGDFSAGLTGWDVEYGTVTDGGGYALFEEDTFDLSSTLSQVFNLDPGSLILSFDLAMSAVSGGDDYDFPPDAFMASLLDPVSYDPLVSNPGFMEFYFLENTGYEETVADVIGSTVSLDVSTWAGQDVLLSFDLFGGDDGYLTSVALDNVNVSVIPAPGALLLGLVGAGTVGIWRKFGKFVHRR